MANKFQAALKSHFFPLWYRRLALPDDIIVHILFTCTHTLASISSLQDASGLDARVCVLKLAFPRVCLLSCSSKSLLPAVVNPPPPSSLSLISERICGYLLLHALFHESAAESHFLAKYAALSSDALRETKESTLCPFKVPSKMTDGDICATRMHFVLLLSLKWPAAESWGRVCLTADRDRLE